MSMAMMFDPLLQHARNLVCDVAAMPALTGVQAGYVSRLDALGMSICIGRRGADARGGVSATGANSLRIRDWKFGGSHTVSTPDVCVRT